MVILLLSITKSMQRDPKEDCGTDENSLSPGLRFNYI